MYIIRQRLKSFYCEREREREEGGYIIRADRRRGRVDCYARRLFECVVILKNGYGRSVRVEGMRISAV